jgi:hypothetical protein
VYIQLHILTTKGSVLTATKSLIMFEGKIEQGLSFLLNKVNGVFSSSISSNSVALSDPAVAITAGMLASCWIQ